MWGLMELGKYASLELRIQESTEKPEGRKFIASQWTYGKTESSYIAAELRIYKQWRRIERNHTTGNRSPEIRTTVNS